MRRADLATGDPHARGNSEVLAQFWVANEPFGRHARTGQPTYRSLWFGRAHRAPVDVDIDCRPVGHGGRWNGPSDRGERELGPALHNK